MIRLGCWSPTVPLVLVVVGTGASSPGCGGHGINMLVAFRC
jgi:hypothetical protein